MAAEDSSIGKQIGNYRIVASLGSGGFADVYQGQHLIFTNDPPIAIKLLYARLNTREREQFIQEAQLLRKLNHPHILSVLDAGFHESISYIVMEYAAQGSLQDRLDRRTEKPLSLKEALTILTQIGEALHYAHQQNIVHRDLKPDNILFNAKGEALLADFGLATLLSSVHTVLVGSAGTPAYMAPEMFTGKVSVKSDQYALGCIAYELITGHKPLEVDGVPLYAVQYQHAHVVPMAPSQYNRQIPPYIEQAVLTALAKDRHQRHVDVGAFLTALQTPLKAPTTQQTPPTPPKAQTTQQIPPTPPRAPQKPQISAQEWSNRGNALRKLKRYEEAITAYEQALRLDPSYAIAYNNKGYALRDLKRYEQALAAFERALRLDPNFAKAHNGKGNALRYLKRYDEALASFERALRLDPNYAKAYNGKGYALSDIKQYKQALAAFEQALRLDPGFASAYNGKGNVLKDLKRYDEALVAYEQALHLDPSYTIAYNGKGGVYYGLRRYNEALAAYEQVLRLDPNFAKAYNGKGGALYGLRRYEEALTAYEQALRLDPNYAKAYRNKGLALDKLGRHREAQQAFNKAEQLGVKT